MYDEGEHPLQPSCSRLISRLQEGATSTGFVMVAKGGGSANKTYFYPMTKGHYPEQGTLLPFLVEKMKSPGFYSSMSSHHIAFVIGGYFC